MEPDQREKWLSSICRAYELGVEADEVRLQARATARESRQIRAYSEMTRVLSRHVAVLRLPEVGQA